jgi:hypothetical protein
MLEEKSNSTAEENLRLVKSLNELDSRVQALDAKAALGEVSTNEKVIVSDDTTNIHPDRGPNNYDGLRGWT